MPTTINPSDQTITQYNIQTGGASNLLNNVAPSATSGVPVISQGAASQPVFGTAVVAGGGTGQTTLTNHGVLVGAATSAITQLSAGLAGQILQSGGASADPAYSTSIYPTTNAVSTLLYASSANVMAALATANNGTLITSGGGVPSISSTLPTAVQGNITSTGNLGNQLNTTRTAFSVYIAADKTAVTGDSTVYTIPYDTASFDQASNFNTSTHTFTAPVTGVYLLMYTTFVSAINVSNRQIIGEIVASGVTYFMEQYTISTSAANYTIVDARLIKMTSSDTATIAIVVTGNATKNITVNGTVGFSTFSGILLC